MLKVVIADDEPFMLEGLRTMVDWHRLGFDICGEAMDGEDALQLIQTYEPHLVVTDIRMPVIDGLQLIERAAALKSKCKFMILSGYGDFQYAKTAMQYGVANYFMKPLDETELENAIAALAFDIRKEEEKDRYEKSALSRIESETIARLLRGDGRQEWIEQASVLLRLNDESMLRCLLLGLSPKSQSVSEQDSNMAWRQIISAAETALDPGMALYSFEEGKNRLGFILVTDRSGPQLHQQTIIRIVKRIRKLCGIDVMFSISREHRGALSLKDAYRESLTAEFCQYPSEVEGVFVCQSLSTEESGSSLPSELKALLGAIENGNQDAVRAHAHQIFAKLSQQDYAPGWLHAHLSNLKLEILRIVAERGGDPEEWSRKWFSIPNKIDTSRLGEMERSVIEQCMEAAEWIARDKSKQVDPVIAAAAVYVKTHFNEKLQLQHVAEHFHLNPAYFGQRFKKQLGASFNEYLHMVRIEEGKKLLRRTDLKISDIAAQVGYSDPEHFVMKFKALTNMLPSAYKKS